MKKSNNNLSLINKNKKSPEKPDKRRSNYQTFPSKEVINSGTNLKGRTVLANVSPNKKYKVVVKESLESFKFLK
jgi:hypothetical protein